jgi:hypothetical protein
MPVTEGLKNGLPEEEEEVLTQRRRLVGGPIFKKVRVATLNIPISVD